jgi:hypothetical protein
MNHCTEIQLSNGFNSATWNSGAPHFQSLAPPCGEWSSGPRRGSWCAAGRRRSTGRCQGLDTSENRTHSLPDPRTKNIFCEWFMRIPGIGPGNPDVGVAVPSGTHVHRPRAQVRLWFLRLGFPHPECNTCHAQLISNCSDISAPILSGSGYNYFHCMFYGNQLS